MKFLFQPNKSGSEQINVLREYLPENAADVLGNWFQPFRVEIKVVKDRITKLGDFKPPYRKNPYRITVNEGLNKYAFLVTLVHELAHMIVWEKYGKKVRPHGSEWKTTYGLLLQKLIFHRLFPFDVEKAVQRHINNIKASSYSDHALIKTLKNYDDKDQVILVEDLEEAAEFKINSGKKVFIKGKKARKRFLCREKNSKRQYYVSAVAEVKEVLKH